MLTYTRSVRLDAPLEPIFPLLHFPDTDLPVSFRLTAMVIGKGILGAGRYFGFQIQSLRDLVAGIAPKSFRLSRTNRLPT